MALSSRARSMPAAEGRTPTLLFGMVLFLASELMFFGALFAAYFTLRSMATVWPPHDVRLEAALPAAGTLILITSSGTFQLALKGLKDGDLYRFRRWLLATLALGTAFLLGQLREYTTVGFGLDAHVYGSLFFTMTGFHGLHVVVGLGLMGVLLGRAAQGAYATGAPTGPEAVGYYWHFVDAVWIALFSTIYLLR